MTDRGFIRGMRVIPDSVQELILLRSLRDAVSARLQKLATCQQLMRIRKLHRFNIETLKAKVEVERLGKFDEQALNDC